MKKIYSSSMIFILSFAFHLNVKAQDIIIKTNGEEIKAKVTEIGISEIKYKRFDNLDGPIIVISKSDVFKINYENGSFELISSIELNTVKKNTSKYNKRREPGWSFLMSFLYPGLGQFYNKQAGKGIAMVIGATSSATLYMIFSYDEGRWLPAIGYGVFWLWSVIDSPVSSSIINNKYNLTSFNFINNNKLKVCLNPDIKTSSFYFANNYKDFGLTYGASLIINFR